MFVFAKIHITLFFTIHFSFFTIHQQNLMFPFLDANIYRFLNKHNRFLKIFLQKLIQFICCIKTLYICKVFSQYVYLMFLRHLPIFCPQDFFCSILNKSSEKLKTKSENANVKLPTFFAIFFTKYISRCFSFFTIRFSLKLPFSQSQQPLPKMFLTQSKLAKMIPKQAIHL